MYIATYCTYLLFVPLQVSLYPGQDKFLNLMAYDELNQTTSAIFHYSVTGNTTKVCIIYS